MNFYIVLITFFSTIIFSQEYFQQDVLYDISVELNDSSHTLSGYEKLIYKNNSKDQLNFIWFHIWPNAYKNDSSALAKQFLRLGSTKFKYTKEKDRGYIDSLNFSVDGISTNWEYHTKWNDVIKVFLPKPLKSGQSVTIETPFFVKLPKIISRLGHTGKHYEITQWYPKPAVYDKDGWHPMPYLNMGEFYSEFGSYNVKITLPEHYRLMATGDIVNGEDEIAWLDSLAAKGDSLNRLKSKEYTKAIKTLEKDIKKQIKENKKQKSKKQKLKTVHFRQSNVHDFAWFADPNWIVQKGSLVLENSNREITLWSMYLPQNAKVWKSSIEYLHDSGYWYSKFYGDYPYNHITAVDGDMSAGGGMEYPNITVISRSSSKDLLEFVIMHEVGHNWFYGILGNNERDYTWLDEGLNEYSNIRYWEKKYTNRKNQIVFQDFIQNKLGIGKNIDIHFFHYLTVASNPHSLDLQPLNISANDNFSYNNYSQNYNRTAVMMRYLQHYLGEDKMDIIMQEFYETWKFKHPGANDFYSIFHKHTDEDLSAFFENVFDKSTFIDFGIKREGEGFLLENIGSFNVPVEVAFYDKNYKEISREWISFNTLKKRIEAPSGAVSAIIDPEQYMPDIYRVNNSTKRKLNFNFIFDRPTYHNIDLNVIPWFFSYNTYNGFMPGLSVWNGFLPGYKNRSIYFNFLFDFKNNKPLAGISYKKEFYQFLNFHSGTWNLNSSNYSGRNGIKIGFKGLIKKPLTKTPEIQFNANLFYHNLNEDAFDHLIYDFGNFIVGNIDLVKMWTPDIFKNYFFVAKFDFSEEFLKSRLRAGFNFRLSKKMNTKIKASFNSFIRSSNVPRQYRNYVYGSVDPNFEQMVFNRTEDSNDLKILKNTYYGTGIRGIDKENMILSNDKSLWHFKIDQTFPYIPGNLFFDIMGGDQLNENSYSVFGIVAGPFIIPFFQSWENTNYFPNNINWILERIRLKLDMNFNFSAAG